MDRKENPHGTRTIPGKVDQSDTHAASSKEVKMVEQTDDEKPCCSTQIVTRVDQSDTHAASSKEHKMVEHTDDEKPCCSTQIETRTENEKPGSSSRKENLCTKLSMLTMMIDGGDDEESDDEIPKELDQATLSRLCVIRGEIILGQEARALSEMTIKMVLEEERRELQVRRITSSLINSAFSAATITHPVKRKKRNIFRRLLDCCFMCCCRR